MNTTTVFNPKGYALKELPIVFGFSNGGQPGFMHALAIAEDGTVLGDHMCSDESYMPADLGLIEGRRPDRQAAFAAHYPDGYRAEFVTAAAIPGHARLLAALGRANKAAA